MSDTESGDANPMFETFCTECGGGEVGGPVVVERTELDQRETNPDLMLSEDYRVEFECRDCDIAESVETDVFPEGKTDHFYSRNYTEGTPTKLRIDGTPVQFKDIDEKTTESALIRHGDVTTSRMRHVHVHALNAPTFTQGNAHRVQIAGYLDEEMMLGDIRYHDGKHRTLKFFRGLDDGIIETVTNLGIGEKDEQ